MSAHEPESPKPENCQQIASRIGKLEIENTNLRKRISRNEQEIIRLQEAIDAS